MFVYKPYQILDSNSNAPILPVEYGIAQLLTLFPTLWEKIIHPMLDAIEKGEKLSEKELKYQQKLIFMFYGGVWIILSFLQFVVIGVNIPKFWNTISKPIFIDKNRILYIENLNFQT